MGVTQERLVRLALAGALALLLTACDPESTTHTPAPEGLGDESASSDFVRAALRDGVVSDQELAEMRDRFRACLESFGFSKITFDANGGFSLEAPDGNVSDAVNEQVGTCADESGEDSLGALHSWVRRNPENLDEDTIVAACLVRKGAVDPSYGAADFAEDSAEQTIPYLDGFGITSFMECNADPLGLFE